jgi:hypothetical protein
LQVLGCPLPDGVLIADIITKLPASWKDFATSLKHKREYISSDNLIINAEENARAKDVPSTPTNVENELAQTLLLVRKLLQQEEG